MSQGFVFSLRTATAEPVILPAAESRLGKEHGLQDQG